jgi:hypothetical protein
MELSKKKNNFDTIDRGSLQIMVHRVFFLILEITSNAEKGGQVINIASNFSFRKYFINFFIC